MLILFFERYLAQYHVSGAERQEKDIALVEAHEDQNPAGNSYSSFL